jgi:hypothetical protein
VGFTVVRIRTWLRRPRVGCTRRAVGVCGVAAGLGLLVSGAAVAIAEPAALAGWQWPLEPAPAVVKAFDPPAHDWLPGNRGVDLAGHPGELVRSSGAGVVSFAGPVARIGVVSVTSGALRTTYEPLRVLVHRGEQVAAGAPLGRLVRRGSHCPPSACLHWGLLRGSTYLDPLSLLGLTQVRLLPTGGATPSGLPPPLVLSVAVGLGGLSMGFGRRIMHRRALARAGDRVAARRHMVALLRSMGHDPPSEVTMRLSAAELERYTGLPRGSVPDEQPMTATERPR